MSYSAYFQKAKLTSYFSMQFMVAVSLFFLGLFEGALSLLEIFYISTPLLSFAVYFTLFLFYPVALPVLSLVIVTVLLDVFFSSLDHSQTFAILVSLLIVRGAVSFPEQRDFMEIWQSFIVALVILLGLQSVGYMIWHMSFINFQSVMFQFGVTVLLYPFLHAIVRQAADLLTHISQR